MRPANRRPASARHKGVTFRSHRSGLTASPGALDPQVEPARTLAVISHSAQSRVALIALVLTPEGAQPKKGSQVRPANFKAVIRARVRSSRSQAARIGLGLCARPKFRHGYICFGPYELDDDGHANVDVLVAAPHDVGVEARTFIKFNDGDVIGRLISESGMGNMMHNPERVDGAAAGRLRPLKPLLTADRAEWGRWGVPTWRLS